LTSAAGYADYDGYIGPIDWDTEMDRKRWGRTLLSTINDNDNNNSYTKHTASLGQKEQHLVVDISHYHIIINCQKISKKNTECFFF
jgi:hypothetical protein